ncbi:MAG: OmpA family protein [Acidobacteria bacterium]|nr:OmpA family protein [Acidobacteriota bacterium]
MLVRTMCCGFFMAALAAPALAHPAPGQTPTTSQTAITQDEIVLQGETTPRRALPSVHGDTGFWWLPTAETMPAGRWSASLFRANFDRRQGLTDVHHIGITAAVAPTDRLELFASWRIVRIDRDVRPTFIPDDPVFGGVSQEYPYLRRGWSKTLGGPIIVGGKASLISQSRGDAMSLAPRIMVKFPSGSSWASTNDWDGHFDLVASREFEERVELTGMAGGVIRGDPDEFRVSDGITWGLGASFPTRSALRALVEWHGEFVIKDQTRVIAQPYVAEDGSIAPLLSPISDPTNFKIGGVWQADNGLFVHLGANYSWGTGGRTVAGTAFDHNSWGVDVRVGWHPGVTPPRERVRVIKETTTVTQTVAAPPPPAPNRNPVFSVNATCNPAVVEVGQTSNCTATATDPDGDPVTYRWTAPQGTFSAANAQNTVWTAPNQVGSVPITVTAQDNRGGTATSTVTVQVVQRETIMFEDVHFDFDRFNLRPEALTILDDAVARLQSNPDLNVTIEGHCDSIGTVEYNLALGERRANSVRDYLVSLGIAAGRLRTVSYGEERPIADNATVSGRAMNRRAHLMVIIE